MRPEANSDERRPLQPKLAQDACDEQARLALLLALHGWGESEIARLNRHIAGLDHLVRHHQALAAAATADQKRIMDELAASSATCTSLEAALQVVRSEREAALQVVRSERDAALAESARIAADLDRVRSSMSWRVTAPLRRLRGWLREHTGR